MNYKVISLRKPKITYELDQLLESILDELITLPSLTENQIDGSHMIINGRTNLYIGTVKEDLPNYLKKDYFTMLKKVFVATAQQYKDNVGVNRFCYLWIATICGEEIRLND